MPRDRSLALKVDEETFNILERVQSELREKMKKENIKARVTKSTAVAYIAAKYEESIEKI